MSSFEITGFPVDELNLFLAGEFDDSLVEIRWDTGRETAAEHEPVCFVERDGYGLLQLIELFLADGAHSEEEEAMLQNLRTLLE